MDSHYDQVMKARGDRQEAPARLYFAYSTVLDRAAFEEWRSQHGYGFFALPEGKVAEALGVDLVYDFPSRWWGGRVAGLADRPGASVFGRLLEIPGKDWPIIQHKEGAITGMCIERDVTVRCEGQEQKATAFTTRPDRASQDGPVSMRFVEALVRGASAAGLPEAYLERIRRDAR
jgi:gamma-glutamylcyclotransferase